MVLHRFFKGDEKDLNSVPLHEGYVYFTEDTNKLFIDISNNPGGRVQVNAYLADALKKVNKDGTITAIDVDDILLNEGAVLVNNGGTGRETLTLNAILLGNGSDPIKMVSVRQGSVILGGDGVKGLTEARGVGALYALTEGTPRFGTLPIQAGGTGADDAEEARGNLDVYSKQEVKDQIAPSTTLAYTHTIKVGSWEEKGDKFISVWKQPALRCGASGDVPPIITYTSNFDEYNQIESAEGERGVGITFTIVEKPTNDIGIIIIDNG